MSPVRREQRVKDAIDSVFQRVDPVCEENASRQKPAPGPDVIRTEHVPGFRRPDVCERAMARRLRVRIDRPRQNRLFVVEIAVVVFD
jgi:hypothetical protein